MTDWDMLVETFPNGRHNFPKFMPDRKEPRGPSRFTTTVQDGAGVARPVHLRGSRHAVDHRRAQPERLAVSQRPPERLPRHRVVLERHASRSSLYEPFTRRHARRGSGSSAARSVFDRIDLVSDGARSVVDGDGRSVENWPEQLYNVISQIDFRDAEEHLLPSPSLRPCRSGRFRRHVPAVQGRARAEGHVHQPGGRRERLAVPEPARATCCGCRIGSRSPTRPATCTAGTAQFDYRMAPIGKRAFRPMATWDVSTRTSTSRSLTDFLETRGLRLVGPRDRAGTRSSGRSASGPRSAAVERGHRAAARRRADDDAGDPGRPSRRRKFRCPRRRRPVQSAAAARLPADRGTASSTGSIPSGLRSARAGPRPPKTYVEFEGRTAFGQRSRIPFHVTSLDWQESDRVLAGIMTAFGSPTGAIPIGGHGEFDGVMLDAVHAAAHRGRSSTAIGMRAWNVVWGTGRADVVIENSYATSRTR